MAPNRGYAYVRPPNASAADKKSVVVGTPDEFSKLSNFHIAAAVLHAVSFVAIAISFAVNGENGISPVIFVDLLRFGQGNVPSPLSNLTCAVSVSDDSTVENTELFSWRYKLAYVLMFMPLITSGFHVAQAILCRALDENSTYLRQVSNGVNWVRWLEYSITASLMTWIIAQLSGITNIYVLFLVAVTGNVSLQWHGLLHEVAFPIVGSNVKVSPQEFGSLKWVPMINGFLIFSGQWMVLMCYFSRTVIANDTGGVPWFVWVSFFGMFLTFMVFPVIQFLATFCVITNWITYEISFIFASLISKFILDWTLLFGTLAERD